jgi:hypothetical protein
MSTFRDQTQLAFNVTQAPPQAVVRWATFAMPALDTTNHEFTVDWRSNYAFECEEIPAINLP